MPNTRPADHVLHWQRALVGNVSASALGLAVALTVHMDADGTMPARFAPGLDKLAAHMGFSASSGRKSVTRLIVQLESKGFLEVKRSSGGKHVVNVYNATVPVAVADIETVPGETQYEGETVSLEAPNRSRGDTHPAQPTHIPTQAAAVSGRALGKPVGHRAPDAGSGTPKRKNNGDSKLSAEDKGTANTTIVKALEALAVGYPADARALATALPGMAHPDAMARRIARLVRDGWEAEVLSALTTLAKPWSSSPYSGCANVAVAAASRVKRLDAELTEPRVDPASYTPSCASSAAEPDSTQTDETTEQRTPGKPQCRAFAAAAPWTS